MIVIKFLGGAKKSFGKDLMQVDLDNVSISKLLGYLLSIKPTNTLEIDTKNILIAVNGADSSALQGYNTILHSGDVVSIIPVIHGGARIQFVIQSKNIELFHVRNKKGKNYDYLSEQRKKFPSITIEGISSRQIASILHVKKILGISMYAKKNNLLLSKKLETDILLRFAATTQISTAINLVGIEKTDAFTIIAIGSKFQLDRMHSHLEEHLISVDYSKNMAHIKKHFHISKKHLEIIDSKNPLEDLLAERAAVLFQ
ncbi:MAG: thiamine biosynthesis protein ThiS [Thaumarchaeota archaeon]|nr:thiamine biosynthesis protein ThiS [Nitrososphaerota archaeon]